MMMMITRAGHCLVAVESIVQLIVINFSDYRLLSQKISLHLDHFKPILAIFDLCLTIFINYWNIFENSCGIYQYRLIPI